MPVGSKMLVNVLGPIRFWSSNSIVINYMELVLKMTDTGAAVIPNNLSLAS